MFILANKLAAELDRSMKTLRNWKRRGCPGFELIDGRLYADFEKVQQWRIDNDASKPGRKGQSMKHRMARSKVTSSQHKRTLQRKAERDVGDQLHANLRKYMDLGVIDKEQCESFLGRFFMSLESTGDVHQAFKEVDDELTSIVAKEKTKDVEDAANSPLIKAARSKGLIPREQGKKAQESANPLLREHARRHKQN